MRICLMLTARCNAKCLHCSTSCGPHRTEALGKAEIERILNEAIAEADGDRLEVLLTGGEPFLDLPLLLEIVAYGTKLGAEMTCVTNGYWATSQERAEEVLIQVKEAGLTTLAVSTSRFHKEFVKRPRVERVLRASRAAGLPCVLKYARLATDEESDAAIAAWAKGLGAFDVHDFAIVPYLSDGQVLPDADYVRFPGIPEAKCPAPVLTVTETGKTFGCCNPGALGDAMQLGDIRESSLQDLRKLQYLSGTHQILREHGPIYFARLARLRGEGARLRDAYGDVCDLCAHIHSDPVLRSIAIQCAEDLEMKQMDAIFTSMIPATSITS